MSATLKDIAMKVGVSINTVSHALKDKPDIGAETTRRVKAAAAALGYRPNLAARNLVLRRTSAIGLAVTEIDNPVRVEFCEKLRALAAEAGYRLLTASLNGSWQKSIGDLLNHHVDGLIVGAVWNRTDEAEILPFRKECRKNRIPLILFGHPGSHTVDHVEIDLEHSVYLLTRHLLERGYREIALFAPPVSIANFRGYKRAMAEAGLTKQVRRLELSRGGMELAYHEMNRLLDNGIRMPRAIVAANDLAALGVMRSLREHGIRIPEQCAVAGVDNIAFGQYSNPRLTSVGFDHGLCAETVWQLMMRRIRLPQERPAAVIPVQQKLFIREST